MENIETPQQTENLLVVNNEIREYLLETSKWGKFLAIVGYVGMGLLILLGLVVIVGLLIQDDLKDVGFPVGIFGILYILIAVVYYFPVTYLYRFSVQMKEGLSQNNQQSTTSGFENLKSVFKFMGIFTIVVLSIYVMGLLIAIPMLFLIG